MGTAQELESDELAVCTDCGDPISDGSICRRMCEGENKHGRFDTDLTYEIAFYHDECWPPAGVDEALVKQAVDVLEGVYSETGMHSVKHVLDELRDDL
jgi:hypothetical protein